MKSKTKVTEVDSYVLKIFKNVVICECCLDKKKEIYEIRKFPSVLFEHIQPLEERHPIRIKITTKPGTIKTDIIDGKDIVDMSVFEVKGWEELNDFPNDKLE